ncbi:MAG: hypothetical protein FJ028_10310 [Chloroflexi bacterium]|nr:hypothetical protein [Chloroflexota bacterium]
MRGITSAMGPGVLWRDHMKGVVGGLPPVWYEPPASVVNATVCVNPSIMGGNGSGLLPSAACPPSFRRSEIFVKGTEPRIDDRDMWIGGCYRLVAHFPVRQPFADRWAANAGAFSGGRFGGVRGTGAPPTPAPTKKP